MADLIDIDDDQRRNGPCILYDASWAVWSEREFPEEARMDGCQKAERSDMNLPKEEGRKEEWHRSMMI
uniref:Retrotransposon protein n=1 Tax=Loa loa TaxID=7209 RepID=A0A1I7VMF5_LOALO